MTQGRMRFDTAPGANTEYGLRATFAQQSTPAEPREQSAATIGRRWNPLPASSRRAIGYWKASNGAAALGRIQKLVARREGACAAGVCGDCTCDE